MLAQHGELQSELAEMDECMPHYYKITNGHGHGAEKIMLAEAAFMQGHFTDAHIELESAYAQIEGNGQENMALCCDFLARRLCLHMDMEQRYSFEERREALLRKHNAAWLNIWSATSAYYHALLGATDKIPPVFAEHQLSTIHFLAPGKPMMEMIENQVYLAQGAYAKVIGRSEGQLAVCDTMHYALVTLHLRIQVAAAYEMLGKRPEAREVLAPLTEREWEIVGLLAERLSNREIAEKLFLSEGSIKQYINQIYSKLHIEGDTRTKRKKLSDLFPQKT